MLLIDDYDVLAASGIALLALLPYLPPAGDSGRHVVMRRRVMGASRGMSEARAP